MLQVSLYGRLGKDAQAFETKTGNPMSAASVAVDVGGRDGEAVTLWVRVLAFGRLAEALAKHTKGETLAASGRLKLSRWTGEDGVARETWQLVADYLHSARTARPGTTKPGQRTAPKPKAAPPSDGAPFDDELPF